MSGINLCTSNRATLALPSGNIATGYDQPFISSMRPSKFRPGRPLYNPSLADRARNKTLRPEEVQGGTFTITNPGGFGTLIGTPIINQPQSGILCFGAVQKRVVVVPGTDSIGVRNMSYLTLTFDHRLIDGAVADQFMESIRKTIETVDCTLDK